MRALTHAEQQIRDAYVDGYIDGLGVNNPDDPKLKRHALASWREHCTTGASPPPIPMPADGHVIHRTRGELRGGDGLPRPPRGRRSG